MVSRIRSPELPQNYPWLNTEKPLSLKALKGRIIILDFWTYGCINCLHILPDLKYLENKYSDILTIIGIHSGKFDNEQETENIRQAILRYDIAHPILIDKNFRVWQDYTVRAWPTLIVIDPKGYIVTSLSGEGHRKTLEKIIEQLKNQSTIEPQIINFTLEKQHQPLTPLAFPGKVLATSAGLFITDTGHHRLVFSNFDGEVIHTIGTGKPGLTDGDFHTAQFSAPQGMTYDAVNQNLYVADTENHALRKVNLPQQTVETIAGTGEQSYILFPHCGKAREAALNSPWDVVKIGNNLFITMAGNHQIWQMDLDQNIIQTYAGIGAEGCIDGNLEASAFAQPSGLTTNGQELFIADSEISSIRGVEIQPAGKVWTVCGGGLLFGFGDIDGKADTVKLQHCLGIEYHQNCLWVADTYNHKIKLVNPQTGECQTVFGDGVAGLQDGKGKNSRFFEPSGLSIRNSHLYISDTNNHAIRFIDLSTGEVKTMKFTGLCTPDFCFPQNLGEF
ncbi:MAG TPA: thioredoxin-like domain-containing protein [Nostocaceae cyanobacterium]|nr:thioredoxin-like domain-containing protein [Nostocaceae cyanobacterium]